jgi:chromosome segregation ATPase
MPPEFQAALDAQNDQSLPPEFQAELQLEATEEPPADPKPVKTFTREDVTKARQQEKDKLYPEITKLREEVAELRKVREEAERQAQEAAQREAEEARRKEEEEMDVRALLAKKEVEWEQKLRAEQEERERAFALFEKERQYTTVQQYRAQQIDLARDDILPELLDLVAGDTPEQIDASINGLKERSARILDATRQATGSVRREATGARVTAPPATDPLDNYSGQQSFTPEQIRAMSVEEYAQYRQAFGMSGGGRGMFS